MRQRRLPNIAQRNITGEKPWWRLHGLHKNIQLGLAITPISAFAVINRDSCRNCCDGMPQLRDRAICLWLQNSYHPVLDILGESMAGTAKSKKLLMDLDAAQLEAILADQGVDCATQETRDGIVLRVNGKDQHGPVLVPLGFPSYVKAVNAEAIVIGRKAKSVAAVESLALSFVQDGADGAATQFALEAQLAESSLSVEKALPTALSIAIPSGAGSYVLQRLQVAYASVPARKGGSKKRK